MEASYRWKTDTVSRVCNKVNPIHILAKTERKAENYWSISFKYDHFRCI